MEPLVRSAPGTAVSPDLHAMVQHSLRKLHLQIASVVPRVMLELDFASAAHLASCQSRIERMLAPKLDEYAYGMLGF
jgi:hypothetical protein